MGQKVAQVSAIMVAGTVGTAGMIYGLTDDSMEAQARWIWGGVSIATGLGLYFLLKFTGSI